MTADTQPGTRQRQQKFAEQLRKIIAQEELTLAERNRRLYKAASRLLTSAAKGEEWAVKELANRLDGKPFQAVSFENPDGTSVNLFNVGMLRGMDPDDLRNLQALLEKAGKCLKAE